MRASIRKPLTLFTLAAMPLLVLTGVGSTTSAMASGATSLASASPSGVTNSSLGTVAPTFVGTAATGCASGCSLLNGPDNTPSTSDPSVQSPPPTGTVPSPPPPPPDTDADPNAIGAIGANAIGANTAGTANSAIRPVTDIDPRLVDKTPKALSAAAAAAPTSPIPSVSCEPMGPGCDAINNSAGGASGVKGLDAVDSGTLNTNPNGDIEPPDQGLCAGNGFVVEDNNIGEMLVFNTALQRQSLPISLDTVMGLTALGKSSGGDPSCEYDPDNGGHWFITEIVSNSTEAAGGAFTGCFAAIANGCSEGIAVSDGNSPFGPYHVYFAQADYNPNEPGGPGLLNDFAKIGLTHDAFEYFYDEFPQNGSPGIGGGFNGAQEMAFNKKALEEGLPTTLADGTPNPAVTVAIENMGLLPTPDGTCAAAQDCWFSVIPVQPADSSEFDNSHGGTGFMVGTLDFNGAGDNRIAVFDWTHLSTLNSQNCSGCGNISFGGELFSGVDQYFSHGEIAPQKAGPIPLGAECGAAGLSTTLTSCPEGGIATNGDNFTQASMGNGEIYATATTEINQTFSSEASPELHQAVVSYVISSKGFDNGHMALTSEGYIAAAHEDLSMPAVATTGQGGDGNAITTFTLTGNGGPTGADNGGFFPSTAFGRLTPTSGGLVGSVINVADAGQSPADGFGEYQGLPRRTRPRWGDYSEVIYMPGSGGRMFFANEYIQAPNCTGAAFALTNPTCGGTRDGFENWGTSVNSVVP
jgi:hypothetical protein